MAGDSDATVLHKSASDPAVVEALEQARSSPEAALDPAVSGILESILATIWGKVQADPTTYVMHQDEFAIFNYFQHRFTGNQTASEARKRYWDQDRTPPNGTS